MWWVHFAFNALNWKLIEYVLEAEGHSSINIHCMRVELQWMSTNRPSIACVNIKQIPQTIN